MEDMLIQIGNYGFPIVISIYLLVRIENKLDELTRAITGLREAVIEMKT
ncbi:MAG: YvrJ family protein [Syntrophomonadaceae bacterium]|nr:YvrJ family protein [Syntrophomonadaceae bacterium]